LLLWGVQPVTTPSIGGLLRYLPWAALQQYLLLVIVARRLDYALAWRPLAVLLAALLFALAHTPNTPLMLLTFTAGLLWVGWFLRRGALLPVILAHALGATLLLGIASDSGWLRSLAIGGRYLGWGG
jgi:membrane protease YdiL (CAAX protease family)